MNGVAGSPYGKIPREEIPWHPSIEKEKCTNCGVCISFCHKDVYEEGPDGPIVANPHNCIVGCTGCAGQCPAGAISFPTLVELRDMLARLREKYM